MIPQKKAVIDSLFLFSQLFFLYPGEGKGVQ